jgi:two-component system, chemotaxis family, protein-glutamate methylesterase/glutaminase
VPGHDIIVIGASAGGVEALVTLVATLPADLHASIFIVLHLPAQAPSHLPAILSRSGPLKAVQTKDGHAIRQGIIYIAPPDHHLLVEHERVRIVRGPKENRHRPAIDPLFRSAAVAYGPRVIGVVLTGSLDDGTAGLLAIKRRGGMAVVQDPDEALYPSMPLSALANVQVDYRLPLIAIGPLLAQLIDEPAKEEEAYPVPQDMEKEVQYVGMTMDQDTISNNGRVGHPSPFSCPECGGVLWEMQDRELLRFRCRVGHAFSTESILAAQSEAIESALWTAMKALEEQASLSRLLARQAKSRGHKQVANTFEERLHEAEQSIIVIQKILQNDKSITPGETGASGISVK